MSKRKILIQLDIDRHPSVFDRVVAIDAGVDEVFSYGGVELDDVQSLVHGAIFTRGCDDLRHTAVFVGGTNVAVAEECMRRAVDAMIPSYGLRVSILLDANGCNTTAAAAVASAARHVDLSKAKCLVLGGTGPVGQRVARLIAREGGSVRVGSRKQERAEAVCERIREVVPDAHLEAVQTADDDSLRAAVKGAEVVIAAGAAGVQLLPATFWRAAQPKVLIDLNAVPPLGIEGVEMTDKAVERDGTICYGAIGVGGLKMKLHMAAVQQLFERNDQVMDAEEVYALVASLE